MKNHFIKAVIYIIIIFTMLNFKVISLSVENNPTINIKAKTIHINNIAVLNITNANKKVKWSTSNKKIVSISIVYGKKSCKAKIVGNKEGRAIITAKVGKTKLQSNIIVEKKTRKKYYITATGSKYHLSGCMSLRKNKIEISLSDAKAQGYTPCRICLN